MNGVLSAPFELTIPLSEAVESFASMELTQAPAQRSQRQEVRPLIGLLMDIIDTVQTSAKNDLKRAKLRTSLSVT